MWAMANQDALGVNFMRPPNFIILYKVNNITLLYSMFIYVYIMHISSNVYMHVAVIFLCVY